MAGRIDLHIISGFVEPGSKVLDLGCGSGDLLLKLKQEKQVAGEGIEISDEGVRDCISKGLAVHHGDIDEGLDSYADGSFDYVVLSQTLQMTHNPAFVLQEMLRVGTKAVVSIPNFGHWPMRRQLLLGRMPVTPTFPYRWYETPNIRFTTTRDFKEFCPENGFVIEDEAYLSGSDKRVPRFLSNLAARLAIFVLTEEGT